MRLDHLHPKYLGDVWLLGKTVELEPGLGSIFPKSQIVKNGVGDGTGWSFMYMLGKYSTTKMDS